MKLFEQFFLSMPHACGMLLGVVVVAEHMQDSVRHEQRDLVVECAGMRVRLVGRNRGTHDHVAHQKRQFARLNA